MTKYAAWRNRLDVISVFLGLVLAEVTVQVTDSIVPPAIVVGIFVLYAALIHVEQRTHEPSDG